MAALVTEVLPLVYNVVGRALAGHSDVDDVVQETMLRAVHGLPGLREPERFRAWLISITIRQVQERHRVRGTTRTRELPLDNLSEHPDENADFAETTITRLSLSGERRDVVAASRFLSPDDHRLLSLWWQEIAGTLSRAELAAVLGRSPQYTAVRIQRMKAQLTLARTLLRAWRATPRCAELSALARNWDGHAEPAVLKRLGRHLRRCPGCLAAGRGMAPAERLLAGIGLVPLPATLAHTAPSWLASAAHGHAVAGHATVGLLGRALHYVTAKPALAAGTVLTTGAAVFAFAVYQAPATSSEASATAPPSVTATVSALPPAAAGAPGPAPSSAAAPPVTGVTVADIYVSPTGSDAGTGAVDQPYATLGKAVSVVKPGQTIALRGGTYRPVTPVTITTSGTSSARITLSNYRSERPVLDGSELPADTVFVTQRASFWTVSGLEIKNAHSYAYLCRSCQHDVFRRLSIHDNANTGLELRDADTIDNQVLDSDFYRNHDDITRGENADGLDIMFGSGGGNVVRGCRLYDNTDDGLDLTDFSGAVTVEDTWSYGNGVNRWQIAGFTGDGYGFKLGGGATAPVAAHIVTNTAAWDNAIYGYSDNNNAASLVVTGNTAYRNGSAGFVFVSSSSVLRHNLALANALRDTKLGSAIQAVDNSWNQTGWTTSVLRSTDPATAEGPRPADGSLPASGFLLHRKDARIGASMTITR